MSTHTCWGGWVTSCCVLIALGAMLIASPAAGDDTAPLALDDFSPLVTRRPVLERELEVRVSSTKRRDGRETAIAPALAMPIVSWWQLTLEMPVVFYRLYGEEQLAVRTKRRKKRASQLRVVPARPTRPNEQWGMDFMADRLEDGRRIRILTVDHACDDPRELVAQWQLTEAAGGEILNLEPV